MYNGFLNKWAKGSSSKNAKQKPPQKVTTQILLRIDLSKII